MKSGSSFTLDPKEKSKKQIEKSRNKKQNSSDLRNFHSYILLYTISPKTKALFDRLFLIAISPPFSLNFPSIFPQFFLQFLDFIL